LDRRLLRSCRVPPASAERDALGMTNPEALPRLRRLVAYDEGDCWGQEDFMGRFGMAAGRTGVGLTVGRLAGPRCRVEVRGEGHRAHRLPSRSCEPGECESLRSARIRRTSRSNDSNPTRFPSESSNGRRRAARRLHVSGCRRMIPREGPGRTRPTIRRSTEADVSPNPFARIRNERYECAQSISALLLSRYICDVAVTEAQEEDTPEGLRRRPD
jgi:hypothetical protein